MRIISPFRDYYDSAQAAGIDVSRTFIRNTNTFLLSKGKTPDNEWQRFKPAISGFNQRGKEHNYVIRPFCVIFCGKAHYGLQLNIASCGIDIYRYFYAYEQVIAAYKRFGINYHKKRRSGWFDNLYADCGDDLKKYMRVDATHEQFLIEKKIAIASYTLGTPNNKFAVNCLLKEFNFQTVYDPYQAFQELDMYVSGVLPERDNAMDNISDECLLKAKGFDCYSFKREPTKRKRKPCK